MEPKIIGERVKKLIKEKKMTKEEVAQKIGIKNKTFEKKLEGKEEFCIDEIIAITKLFDLKVEECAKIFFDKDQSISEMIM